MSGVVDSPEHGKEETVERDNVILPECVVPVMDREGFEHGVGGEGESSRDHEVDEEDMTEVLENFDDADNDRTQQFIEKKPPEGFEKGESGTDGKYRAANIDDIVARKFGSVVVFHQLEGNASH